MVKRLNSQSRVRIVDLIRAGGVSKYRVTDDGAIYSIEGKVKTSSSLNLLLKDGTCSLQDLAFCIIEGAIGEHGEAVAIKVIQDLDLTGKNSSFLV